MPRQIGKLSALAVQRLKKSGLHADGGGLYLRITNAGGKFWAFRYMLNKTAREMGLGALHAVTLAEARQKATAYRNLLSSDIDPIQARDATRAQERLEAARAQTFRQCAEAYIEAHKASWRNPKHRAQWDSTLKEYVYPVFGDLPVQDVDVSLVMKALEGIWKIKPETASRIRGRIEAIIDWATVRGYRRGENPARWRGHLENLLPRRSKVKRIIHRPALPYDEIGDFMGTLKEQHGTAALALAFTILTAARTSEAIGARWDEIDLQKKMWIVPANRIKAGREHRVPLSDAVIRILVKVKKQQGEATLKDSKQNYIFTGYKPNKPLSNMAMLALLRRMKQEKITTHGFRSTFRDWCAEQTNYPREVAEAALAHVLTDKVEAAYQRGDLFDKRKQLMEAWSRFCSTPSVKSKSSGKVLKLRA
jgi:integrase